MNKDEFNEVLNFAIANKLEELRFFEKDDDINDSRLNNFYQLYKQSKELNIDTEYLFYLINKFTYIENVKNKLKLINKNNLKKFFTLDILTCAENDDRSNSSNGFLQTLTCYLNEANIIAIPSNKTCITLQSIPIASSSIIVVEDFIGTGSKILKKIKQIKNLCLNAEIKIFVFTISRLGYEKLKADIAECNIMYCIILDKVISESDLLETTKKEYKYNLEQITNYCLNNPSNYLGFGECEILFKISDYNTPNNNIKIFYDKFKSSLGFTAIFPRRPKNG